MKRISTFGMVFTTVALLSALEFVYSAAGANPPDAVARLAPVAFALACVFWIVADAQKRRQTPCYDFGFLVAVFFPISLVWYVFWSRGTRGILLLAAFVVLMVLPSVFAVAAWLLRNGLP
jgi:hypothetical protein